MDASANAGLLRRLEQLERSNRRLKILAVVVLLGLGGIGVMGQARPPAQIVEAQEFIVKDANGNVRARLAQIYGSDFRFELTNDPEGGLTVVMEIPFQSPADL